MSRIIQKKELPADWLIQVERFDVERLDGNSKIIANKLIEYIKAEKESALQNIAVQSLIKNIFFNADFLHAYDCLPKELVEGGMNELGNSKNYHLTAKLHSTFVEFLTYQHLVKQGYVVTEFKRSEGSCDLQMKKNDTIHHFEVKFKENKDIQTSRLFDFIDGFSMLPNNGYLRGKHFDISLLVENITYKNIDDMLGELKQFITSQKNTFKGNLLEVYQVPKGTNVNRTVEDVARRVSDAYITNYGTEDLICLIYKVFVCSNGHLTKLIKKYNRKNADNSTINFHGVIAWTVPFHLNAKSEDIKAAFQKVYESERVAFPLHVTTSGIAKEQSYFCISGSQFK